MRAVFLFVWLMLALAPAARAQDVVVRAEIEETVVAPDGLVNYAVVVAGEGTSLVAPPDPPPASGLALVDPYPTTQADISTVNGVTRQSVVFRWVFRPTRSGRASIGAARVRVGNRTYRTEPLALVVTGRLPPGGVATPTPTPSAPSAAPDPAVPDPQPSERADVFMRAEASSREVWQGEQVVVSYRLYFDPRLTLENVVQAGTWDAEGFWREELPRDQTQDVQRVNGRTMASLVVKRVALFATRSGRLRVAPYVLTGEAYSAMDFFHGLRGRMEPVRIEAPAVEIAVRGLPGGAPPSFGGAVGRFSLDVATGKSALTTGEATTLTATVRGDGNLATLPAPLLALPAALDAYPPRVETDLDRSGQRVSGTKTFEYRFLPLEAGRHALPPLAFTYFDPQDGRYVTLSGSGMTVQATGPPVARRSRAAAAAASDSLRPPPPTAALTPATRRAPLHRQAWPYVLLAIPLALLLVSGRRPDRPRTARATARPGTSDRLADARAVQHGPAAAFYDALARALEDAAETALGQPVRGSTRAALDADLRGRGLPDAAAGRLADVLRRADLARFASHDAPPAQRQDDLAATEHLLTDLAALPSVSAPERLAGANDSLRTGGPPVASLALLLVALALPIALPAFAQATSDATVPTVTSVPASAADLSAAYEAAVRTRDVSALHRLATATNAPEALVALGTLAAEAAPPRVPLAVWAFERALVRDPSDTLAQHNLGVLRARTGLDSLARARPDLAPALWTGLVRRAGAGPLFALGAALWWSAAILLALRRRGRARTPGARRAALVLVPLSAALLAAAVAASAGWGVRREAVVAASGPLRAAPSESSEAVGALPAGAVVEVRPGRAAWPRVRLANGTEGYVPPARLWPLDAPPPAP